jgi:hypothetical protein
MAGTQGAWVLIAFLVLSALGLFTLEFFFTVSFFGILTLSYLFAPDEVDSTWWLRLRLFLAALFIVFLYLTAQRIFAIVQ